MRLIDALTRLTNVRIFQVLDSSREEREEWDVEPADAAVLAGGDGFYIVKAKNIQPNGKATDCYIDVSLPERISDYAYFVRGKSLNVRGHHEFAGEIICAVPIDCFGVYELFYSKIAPSVGIEILKEGLKVADRKQNIAEDLAYILRDERRFAEAAEMFQIAVNEGESSHFICGELAACYDEIGNKEMAEKYRRLFENPSTGV